MYGMMILLFINKKIEKIIRYIIIYSIILYLYKNTILKNIYTVMSYYSNPSPYTNSYTNSYNQNSYTNNNSYNQNNQQYNNSYQNNQQYNNNDEDDEDDEDDEEQYDEEQYDEDEEEEEQEDEEDDEEYDEEDDEEYDEEDQEEEEDDEDDEETYDRRTWDMGHAKHDEAEEFYCKTCGEVHYNGDECPDNKPNDESEFEICAICQDELNNGRMDAKCLCCNAWFHKSCIKKSRKHSYECPCCKGNWEYVYDWLEDYCRNGPIFKSL